MWDSVAYNLTLAEAKKLAKEEGFDFYFDWESPRTEEGFYRIEGSVLYCVKRGLVFSEYSDMLWMETPSPDL